MRKFLELQSYGPPLLVTDTTCCSVVTITVDICNAWVSGGTPLSLERDIDLVNDLRAQPAETTWLEFKSNLGDHEKIGCLISALSNSARLDGKESAFLIWGIEDGSHDVIGTTFDPCTKTVGNQVFELWLRQQLSPAPVLQFRRVDHPNEVPLVS